MYQYFFFANKDFSTTKMMFQPTLKDHLRITSANRKDLNENSKKNKNMYRKNNQINLIFKSDSFKKINFP